MCPMQKECRQTVSELYTRTHMHMHTHSQPTTTHTLTPAWMHIHTHMVSYKAKPVYSVTKEK